ncbi:YqaJ viral recombinase family protein, partial [Enterococcus faecalis]|nr:endonuclease [Enterococcus faecalis]EGO8438454.1 endonuclease [Enterococcus faecalis]EHD3817575.1 endonuclease [Enterococcus faecalis]EIP8148833.1 YqaJ viral recombinase family protein [Enterococcus faecalis]EIX8413049.1 YqaJ viral recombinase family protein [Enterococcus faecalis]
MIQSTLSMSYQEWLEDRRKGIGGSDVATILGLNQYKS